MTSFRDRVRDTTTTTGTGDLTLSGTPPLSFQSFIDAYPDLGSTFVYGIEDLTGGQWETGIGYLTAPTTFVRDTVYASSAGVGVKATFVAGTKNVFVTAAARFIDNAGSGAIHARINGRAMP